jgi:putative ABC transport system permease protein
VIRRAPAVSAAVVLTLALGIAANVAVFSVAWPVLGARLPFPDEGRLAYVLLSIDRNGRHASNPISPGDYFDLLNAQSFESLAGFNLFAAERNLAAGGDPQRVQVGSVTEEFFDVLGIPTLVGRGLDARDFAPGIRSLVLSERAWRRYFGANPNVVGTSVRMDAASWTVVGVVPAAAGIGTIDVDAWTTQPLDRASARATRSYFLAMVGRLHDGVSLAQANDELARLMRGAAERYPASNRMPSGAPLLARAESFRERLTGPVRPVFVLLIGGAALVLVLAAINLAGLQAARNLARRRELAVREALGATRLRLIRQMTIESLVLSVFGGAVGLGAAAATLAGLSQVAPAVAWYEVSPRLTPAVMFYTVALTAITGLAIGLAPAAVASAARQDGLLQVRGGTDSRRAARLRPVLIGLQVAMTVVLLIAAALTGFSLARVLGVDPGFELEQGIIADVRPQGSTSQQIAFFDRLVERAEALPGVERACAINNVPLDNDGGGMTFVAEGQTDAQRRGALPMGITEGCFDVLRIPLLGGRSFQRRETESVAIVSESMARALWPDGTDPVGSRIHMGLLAGPLFRVVGVASDIRAASLDSAETRQVWMSASRGWPMPQRIIVRTRTAPEALARPLRSLLQEMDPDLALANVRTMRDIVGEATASRRFVLVLLGAFAAIALALCAVGIYGVITYQIGQRTREIGIRVALGASRWHVVRSVARDALVGVAAGIGAGAAGALALSSVIASQLYEVSATDPRVFLAVAMFVVVLALVACLQPVRRILGLNPVAALRAE